MARERENDVSDTSQSKRPALGHYDSSDQTQQPPPQHQHQHHQAKGQKHVVGGGLGGRPRMHARVPSARGLHKHHAATSSTKLNRRRSISPDGETEVPPESGHRRATSDVKLPRDQSSSNLKKNSSHTSLKQNQSHVDVSKKSKSSISLKRAYSNPAVHKLKSAASKVHFNLGDDADDLDQEEDGQDDEWVDASTSNSPLLSRRSSTATGLPTTTPLPTFSADGAYSTSPLSHDSDTTKNTASNGAQSLSQSVNRDPTAHNQYLTSRILQRTPSYGAPPMMSTENVSVRPVSSRQNSPDSGLGHDASTLSGTPRTSSQVRPGSSGNQELTSRFVGHNSQEPGSEIPVDSFLAAVHHGGISRAAVNGKLETNGPRRPRSMGSLAQAQVRDLEAARGIHPTHDDSTLTDEEDLDSGVLAIGPRTRRSRAYVGPTDTSRTQQKLNLQRASSTLEGSHPHQGIGMGLGGVPVAAGPLAGGSSYDSRDLRLNKILERTGMEYLVVRRHQNPIARSIARLAQLPGADRQRPIPRPGTRPGTAHSKRGSDVGGGRPGPTLSLREREARDPSVAALIGGHNPRRPATPRSAFSSRQVHSASSSLGTDDDISRIHERHGLSGSSLVNGEEDADTIALLRQLWDKNMDLSASQD
ncbi:hypothetical protein B0H67DRAFT_496708 [Lasiosphaeris hirsuta]|uniref:Uncharacterized protein n=1 Tax=Lasiosphaeris hirsuta TaxID=260670 RepID=A0AA40A174_9PEZI|nr:hypothetical protein B0H67DRAFT_496708 [Lasiosphaeris hirsuta]